MTDPAVLWTKLGFSVVAFCEGYFAGIFPTYSKKCRDSPKILGIANAFAAGVFMGIAFLHILPEEIEIWNEIWIANGKDDHHVLPLPTILLIAGYTLILIIDKVLFDTHSMFQHDDNHGAEDHRHSENAQDKFRENLKASFKRVDDAKRSGSAEDLRKSIEEENKLMEN